MTQRLDEINKRKGQGSRPKLESRHKWAQCPKIKINIVARTKLGVYNTYSFESIIHIDFRYHKIRKYHMLSPTLMLTRVCRSCDDAS